MPRLCYECCHNSNREWMDVVNKKFIQRIEGEGNVRLAPDFDYDDNGSILYEKTWRCPNCGHTETNEEWDDL